MSFTFDFRDVDRAIRRLEGFERQVPFALAKAMNATVEIARKNDLPQAWSQHITARNPNFLKAALSTTRARANKRNLRVELYDRLGRGNLALHDAGGARSPRGGAIAVPSKANLQPKRGSHGVPKGLRPRNVPNSFVKQSKYGPVLFQRVGTYKKATKNSPAQDNRHLKAMYGLAPSVRIRADMPFHAEFSRIVKREMPRQYSKAIREAMATAFRR